MISLGGRKGSIRTVVKHLHSTHERQPIWTVAAPNGDLYDVTPRQMRPVLVTDKDGTFIGYEHEIGEEERIATVLAGLITTIDCSYTAPVRRRPAIVLCCRVAYRRSGSDHSPSPQNPNPQNVGRKEQVMGKSYRNERHEHSGAGPQASQRRASTPKYRRNEHANEEPEQAELDQLADLQD